MNETPIPSFDPDHSCCLPLNARCAALARVGGKGLNLAKLARGGFAVPDGFVVTVDAYDAFAGQAGLAHSFAAEVAESDTDDPEALAALSARLRARMGENSIPAEIATPIRSAYAGLGRPLAAVRSSATAEDLPELSFAGLQDTFLNVQGEDELLAAIAACWSSLWTARAIGYRARNGIDQSSVAMAVVVQKMVQSETSGVLFTANPLTGRRAETVIDATFGLGEALVSGQVEPDHYVVESESGVILEKRLGAKATVMRGKAGGGVMTIEGENSQRQALSDAQIGMLTETGQRAAALFGSPQDIEWAFAGGEFFLLQSRPITSLFPLPASGDDDNLRVYVSLGAIQGVLGPFTPFGQDLIGGLFAGIAQLFRYDASIYDQPLIDTAAERPWVEVSGALRNPIGRRIFLRAFPLVEPGAAGAARKLVADPRLGGGAVRLNLLGRIAPFAFGLIKSLLRALLRPEAAAQEVHCAVEARIAAVEERMRNARTLDERIDLCEWSCYNALLGFLIPLYIPLILAGYGSLVLLQRLASALGRSDSEISPQRVLDLTRSLPNNVTTEMDLEMWQVAERIRQDSAAAAFAGSDADRLARDFRMNRLPASIQSALSEFLDRYGMRGLAEIDFGQPRWREQPVPIIRALQSYLSMADESAAPDRVFRQGQQAAAQTTERLAVAATRSLRSPLGGHVARWLARRVRALAGLRESPKFTLIRAVDLLRSAMLESGRDLVRAGVLERADDLFYLRMRELKTLAMNAPGDWRALVRARRAAERNERRRQPIPRLLLGDGTAIFAGLSAPANADGEAVVGSGVSPGVAEGAARVVFNPADATLHPGEILVCPGTDPSWTPLFLAAGGLVMEVGGMMTHGSVVAREYGIPAVVGVDRATERLQTGQRVRVDGGSGRVDILE